MFDSKTIALIMLSIVLLCMCLLLVRYIKTHQTLRVWFVAGATLLIAVVWIIQFIRKFG